ncbi:MAG: GIDE domain-containing protein [Candidatus Sedimenticola sp. (ex Thyasira tokunagai)]
MSLSEKLLQLPTHEFWLFLGIATAIAIAAFYFAFRSLSRARLIEDVPTAKVRSAQQGYVELEGEAQAMKGLPIIAPLTGSHCCWYHYKIEKRGDKNWHTVESDTSDGLFLLVDDTGECVIDPEGAEVTPSDRSIWHGHERHPSTKQPAKERTKPQSLFGLKLNISVSTPFSGRYRYTEERIYPADPLYAIGLFKTYDELDHREDRTELIREKLRAWKQDRPTLLQRFDLDRNGEIDQAEWQVARTTAEKEARHEHSRSTQNQPIHQLSASNEGRLPFLLSSLPQFDLARRYRWKATGSILLFFICGGIAAWILGVHLS